MTEAFICAALRTPIGRYGGALAGVRADDLAAVPIAALLRTHPQVDWAALDDVVLGCANQAGEDNRNVARMAALLAGLPETVPGMTVNAVDGSGLGAVAVAARAIRCGEASLVIAGGIESMSRAPFVMAKAEAAFSRRIAAFDTTDGWRFINPRLAESYGIEALHETADDVAETFAVRRGEQDAFALRSHQRAVAASQVGRFDGEIVAVTVQRPDAEPLRVAHDEQPRAETSLDRLARLATHARTGGTVTAGNAAGPGDGACALFLASEAAATSLGLEPLARVAGAASAGNAPRLAGIAAVPATRKLLARLGLGLERVDVVELDEAFASHALAVLRELGLPDDAPQVNPNGGAIALGHPLGMTGARLVTAAAHELRRRRGRFALCASSVAAGQGVALMIERV
jgi:acetyl-CoA acyltransferase